MEAAIAFAVGCALAECALWGKARQLLERAAVAQSLPLPSRRRAWLLLAQIAEQQGSNELAASCYQAAARL